MRKFRIVVAALLPLFSLSRSQAAFLTPQQALNVKRISDVTFSPDGSLAVFTVSDPPKGDTAQSHIWLLDVQSKQARQLTYSAKTDHLPRWSPDGKTVAFLSDRQERAQIYLLSLGGGEAQPLTSGKNAIESFRWSPDGKQIAFLAKPSKADSDEKKEKDKDDAEVSDREVDLSRIWTVDVANKKVQQITSGSWKISSFEWLSGDRILAVANDHPREEIWQDAIYSVTLPGGHFEKFCQPPQPFGDLSISPGGQTIALVATRDKGPVPHDLFLMDTKGGSLRNVTAKLDRIVFGVKWADSKLAVIGVADGFQIKTYKMSSDGKLQEVKLQYSAGDFDLSSRGILAFVGQDFTKLPELYLQEANGPAQQVTHLQEGWNGLTLANAEVFQFKSFDGKQVEAALMQPVNKEPGKKLPLIAYVHGGPAGLFSRSYAPWPQLLVSHGYQVLMVNPRGSIGYGEQFLKANHADWGGGDFKDVMAGVDAVLARGETEPERLGIAGWSYGGYMAEWAITQTQRFKAAVSGAGMFDLGAEYGTEVGPEGDEWYFGTPWEHPELFAHSSPMTYIKNAKTPTLILQGQNDPIDPVGQSTALYRALKRYGVPTELVIYPREPHGPHEEKHQLDILTRLTDWFDRYLASKASP